MKMHKCFWHSIALMLCAITVGCAGFRGGWESAAYVGDAPAAEHAGPESGKGAGKAELALPGLKLQVSLDNRLRTYDTQIFFGLPLSVDPRHAYPKNHRPGGTRVFVTAMPQADTFVFRPQLALLMIGGQRYAAARGYEFGMWDTSKAPWRRVESGGKWEHRDVGAELALANAGIRYFLSLDFDVPTPSPESPDIALDLSEALKDATAANPPLPLIRFAPVRWKEGYT
ncbi:MAG TPA: hypothetical protein VHB01_06365 [Nitrosospira sp.]|nr:hypothetical protein [Nitrosospira sp.]